ncbi:hypothetical protein [Lactiplantibacillus fabifermentans]|uniref:Uncharacterized protein n=2 Tax=Lactiplantibacillus fabifermentans TaxID=483011 RepID=A0A0R2NNI2_9LACO|nr:hypothetical protein [Lactiplantibacillus fabifermentans]ETY73485.1 hypothetical protein LFAB_12120 [Lactiplantibacillus fabifermentans T30PCM01]KRO27230.1 hypothetical protein DY78_GL000201 [Lactiplantibacillus fabifermentans DSM 21115]
MMMTLKMHNGLIQRQTVVVDSAITYQIDLVLKRWCPQPFIVKVTATTLIGTTILTIEHFADVTSARTAFSNYFNDLAQK